MDSKKIPDAFNSIHILQISLEVTKYFVRGRIAPWNTSFPGVFRACKVAVFRSLLNSVRHTVLTQNSIARN